LVFAKIKYNMGKITEIKFVGQPIFKPIMNLVEKGGDSIPATQFVVRAAGGQGQH